MLAMVGGIECPVMYHYGDADSFIPAENVDEVERTVAACPGVEFHRYSAPAGHAFSNWDAPSMYHAPAAEAGVGPHDRIPRTATCADDRARRSAVSLDRKGVAVGVLEPGDAAAAGAR